MADPTTLAPPFEYHHIEDGAVRWHDINGRDFGQLDLYRWAQQLHRIIPANYATEDEYMAAWRDTEAAIEAATAAAWASVDAAGVVWDDERRRYVQQLRAV